MKLLLVDSNDAFAHQLRGDLLRSGAMLCELELATTIAEAARQLGEERFDAVLIDPFSLDTPPASVYSQLTLLAPRMPIIVLSDNNDDAAAIEAVRQGAHDYLIKSQTQPEWLLRRVRYALDRNRGESARAKLAGPHHVRRAASQVRRAAAVGATGANSTAESEASQFADAHWSAADDPRTRTVPEAGYPQGPGDELARTQTGPAEPGDSNCWRILHIEDDPVFLALSDKLLRCDGPHPLHVTHAGDVASGTDELKAAAFDAVLLELSLPDQAGLAALTTVLEQAGETPVVVVTTDDEAATAVDGMRRGAEDFLGKSEPDMRYLRRAAQLAIVRRDRALRMPPMPAVETTPPPPKPPATATDERRRHARYLLTKPIFATPVLPDGSPAATYSADGFTVDVSEGGLRFEIGNLQRLPTTHLLVGIEGLDTVLYFATVEARHVVQKGNGLDVGAQFAKGSRDLIRKENLEPTFNPLTGRYETGLPVEVITKWVEFGILRPALFDRTFVCPQCRALPTFRNGCRVCGSVRLHSRPLIHHFACAHVGYVSDFEQGDNIVCPKCRTRNLIVGADFEHLHGPYHCLDCDWSDTDLDTVGQCMKCELRFPMTQAIEEDLIGYHVNRLDPLAFINAG